MSMCGAFSGAMNVSVSVSEAYTPTQLKPTHVDTHPRRPIHPPHQRQVHPSNLLVLQRVSRTTASRVHTPVFSTSNPAMQHTRATWPLDTTLHLGSTNWTFCGDCAEGREARRGWHAVLRKNQRGVFGKVTSLETHRSISWEPGQ